MTLEKALQTLRNAEAELRANGVIHAGIFGSLARGQQRSDSDIVIDFDPAAPDNGL